MFKNVIFVSAYQRITTERKDWRQAEAAIQAKLGEYKNLVNFLILMPKSASFM